ncbi:hypothetical protein AB0B01_08590 [Streptomyces sp. NPDC044571]|uniref:hypothetical protein n=1 Tax=Streptomyces sp. NPDC044571 TaxID=3155371 RepID=UPI0033F1E151
MPSLRLLDTLADHVLHRPQSVALARGIAFSATVLGLTVAGTAAIGMLFVLRLGRTDRAE